MKTIKCYRCNGTGTTPHKHIANGVCFACGGSGILEYKEDSLENSLMWFHKEGRPTIMDGCSCKMIKSTSFEGRGVDKGGEFIAKRVGESVIFWNKKAGANWHFDVPVTAVDLMKKHFMKLSRN